MKVHFIEKTLNSYIYMWYHYVTICHYACHEKSYTCTCIDTVFQSAGISPCLFSISLCLVHVPETEDWGSGWFFRSSFGGVFFSPFLDAKRWDECDLAGFFTDIILSKQVSQFITHFFKKQLLADKLRISRWKKKHWLDSFWISKCDVKFIGFCEWTMFSF